MRHMAWVDTGYACGGIEFENGRIVNAAPIYRWMIGKPVAQVRQWRKIKRWVTLP